MSQTIRGTDYMDITQDSKLASLAMGKSQPDVANAGDSAITDLLSWNNLTYTMPITNSVTAARNIKRYPALQREHSPGQHMEFRIQSGSQFVDWRKSCLQFKVKLKLKGGLATEAYTIGWGAGSVLNLIDSIVVSSRSGTELQRIEKFNIYRAFKDRMVRDRNWFATVGRTFGYVNHDDVTRIANRGLGSYAPGLNTENASVTQTVVDEEIDKLYTIPMYMFDGLFNVDQLCPSYLTSGMRIEIRLVDHLAKAFVGAHLGGEDVINNATLTLTDAYVFVDTHLLNDASTIELKKVSANNGLEYVYKQVYHQQEQYTTPEINTTLTKAVSRALNVFAVRIVDEVKSVSYDNFIASTASPTKYQFRLGSLYYPHQPLEGKKTQSNLFYWNMLYCYDQLDSAPDIDGPDAWEGFDKTTGNVQAPLRTLCASFERSNLLRFSGAPINNSRSLSIDAVYDSTEGNTFHMFLDYVTIAQTFLNNVVVTL